MRFDELHGSLNDLIGEIKGEPGTISDYAAQGTRGLLGFTKDALVGVGELAYEGSKLAFDAQQTMLTPAGIQSQILDAQILLENIRLGNVTTGTMTSSAVNTATSVGKAIVAPVTDAWAKGQYVESVTRATAEIATLPLVALKSSKVAKAGKAADALSDANKATQVLETAQDSTAAAKSTEAIAKTDEVAKAANASDATKAPESKGPSGDGGKIEPSRSTKPTDKEIELAKSEGNSPKQIAARKKVAEDFYAEQGMPKHKIPSHNAGIDFSKPVDVTTLPKGKYVNQYQVPNATQGSYYSEKGISPTKLGIADSAQNRTTGVIVQKQANSYQVNNDVNVLPSTASKIEDNWSIPGETIKTEGGATQYFTMEKIKFTRN